MILLGLVGGRAGIAMRCRAHRLNLDVNHRVMALSTLSTMTVLPEPPLINPACGVSSDSSDNGGAWCADINHPDIFLPQQIGHDLDLQFRVRRATPGNCDRTQLERDHVRT